MNYESGWVNDPIAVQENIQQRKERGDDIFCSSFAANNRPELVGYWPYLKSKGVVGVYLTDSSKEVNGKHRRPFFQKYCTCVDRGVTGGVQMSLDFAIANKSKISRKIVIQFGSTYIGSRVNIGGGRINGQGSILAWAVQCIHDLGVMEVQKLPSWDFTSKSEDVNEAKVVEMSNRRLPQDWLDAMKGHTCKTFYCESLDRVFDCLAAGFAVPYAFSNVTGKPDKNGLSGIGSYGPHCRVFSGVYVDSNGVDQLVSKESWGRFPAGDAQPEDSTMPIDNMPCITIQTAEGPKKLGPGEVGVNAGKFAQAIYSNGEVFAVSPPTGFEPSTLSELL